MALSSNTKSAKSKEMRDRKAYRRAVNYCSRFFDGDPTNLTDKEHILVSGRTLKLVRKFERTHPNVTLREPLISQISTRRTVVKPVEASKKATTAGILCSSGKLVSKDTVTKKHSKLKSATSSKLALPNSSVDSSTEKGEQLLDRAESITTKAIAGGHQYMLSAVFPISLK